MMVSEERMSKSINREEWSSRQRNVTGNRHRYGGYQIDDTTKTSYSRHKVRKKPTFSNAMKATLLREAPHCIQGLRSWMLATDIGTLLRGEVRCDRCRGGVYYHSNKGPAKQHRPFIKKRSATIRYRVIDDFDVMLGEGQLAQGLLHRVLQEHHGLTTNTLRSCELPSSRWGLRQLSFKY
ncbi:hypothetical protein IG631_00425 [Alternaria alternata]|nr:hypothetical protein IG631_00425 [Alternaria alternata]